MSRQSKYNNKYTTASHPAPIYHRPTPSHHSGGDMPLSSGDLLTLIPTKEVLRKPPNKRNHHHLGASSKPVSAGGGKKVSSGGGDGESEEGSSDATSQDDEDADDEDEDDQDDEKPAVKGPARVKLQTRKYIITENEVQSHIPAGQPLLEGTDVVKSNIDSFCTPKKKTPAIYNGNTTATENDTRAGQNPKKRSYSTASTMTAGTEPSDMDDAGVTETDEEPNYPRKRVARGLSTSNGYLQYSMNENDIHQDSDDSDNAIMEDTNDEDDEDDEEEEDDLDNVDIDDDLDEGALLDEDEKDIEKVEEAAIIRELDEKKCADNFNNVNTVLDNDFAFDGILSELDPALDPDFFDPRWLEPGAQGSELTIDQVLKSRDLFSVPGSQADSPELHGELGSPPPDLAGLLSSDGWSEFDADINYLDHNNPFFEKEDPAVKHVMNAKWNNNWLDDTDDEPDVWRYCIGSGDSSDDEGSDEASLAGDEEEEASEASEEEYDSDATDVEENLPLPTPRKDSKLRRLSVSSPAPQVLHRDPTNRDGPFLGSWIADSDRPICIIDGNRKTILLPPCPKRFSMDSDSSSHHLMPLIEDSEPDFDVFAMAPFNRNMQYHNPTLTGLTGGAGGYLGGTDIFGPPEAFGQPVEAQFDDFLRAEYGDAANEGEESLDEGEHILTMEDMLNLSSDDDEDEDEDAELVELLDISASPVSSKKNLVGNGSDAEATLTRWDLVSVTAFRKRQQLHKQRLADQSPSSNRGKNALKRLTVSDTTMTPARRRKKVISGVGSPTIGNRKKARKEEWNYKLSPLFEGL